MLLPKPIPKSAFSASKCGFATERFTANAIFLPMQAYPQICRGLRAVEKCAADAATDAVTDALADAGKTTRNNRHFKSCLKLIMLESASLETGMRF